MLFFQQNINIFQINSGITPYWYKYAYVNIFSTVGAHIGHTIKNSDGKIIPTRFIGEQHVKEDIGWIPSMQDWFMHIKPQPWMAKVGVKTIKEDEEAKLKTK